MKDSLNKKLTERYLVAKDAWSANRILKQIAQGKLSPDQVLFPSSHSAAKRIARMSRDKQLRFSVYKTDFPRMNKQ